MPKKTFQNISICSGQTDIETAALKGEIGYFAFCILREDLKYRKPVKNLITQIKGQEYKLQT